MLPFLDILTPIISKVLDYIPDPKMKAEAQLKLQVELDANSQAILSSLASMDKGQTDINVEEAKSSSIFVAGWRPFLGWVFGSSFAWVFVCQPILTFLLKAIGHPVELPTLDMSQMVPLVTGMLGLAGLRTYEKQSNTQGNH